MLFTAVSSAVYKVSSCTLSYNYEIRIPNLDIVMMLNYITTLICIGNVPTHVIARSCEYY